MAAESTIALVRDIRQELAPEGLLPFQAKLYSQRVRREMGRAGLASFSSGELNARLEEAMLLLQAAWIEKAADGTAWRLGVKRAAELLEWLSETSLRPTGAPLHLLSAAAYQVAGYPAMALGHLRRMPEEEPFSALLREFLRADFDATLKQVQRFWSAQHDLRLAALAGAEALAAEDADAALAGLEMETVRHVVMAIGTICAYLRTGETALVDRAVIKLEALAQSFLHSRDPFSYLLARLTAASAQGFIKASLWLHVEQLAGEGSPRTRAALTQFARSAFVNRRSLVWPAQAEGISRLASGDSFVLCTPTGSGKTTVATLGAVQGLFAEQGDIAARENLVLYLVPSRALAAEVEARFSEDLLGIARDPVVVTGLYGGVDWGPTDAWVQSDSPTVVICTFEKADALLRYLGTLFLDRVRLVVIDEAHMVEQDPRYVDALRDGTSRSLRLEQLSARLLRAREDKGFRLIALSAVAAQAAPAMASWLSSEPESAPITSTYRSTRQMLGRLEVSPNGKYEIRYDLMDGRSLEFEDERTNDVPYVPQPFASVPEGLDQSAGPEVRMRAPTLWAALHLAAERPDGMKPTVMISLTQMVSPFARSCADQMDSWLEKKIELPNHWSVSEGDEHWASCLAAAEDYFTRDSAEYRLLARGIAVHHGQMPALLARRLKVAIDRGNVRVVIATSTLSEGVNIPVNTLLIPSVHRANSVFSTQEFTNLIGRAGRPGVATEGTALVILPEREKETAKKGGGFKFNRTWDGYEELIDGLKTATDLADQSAATAPRTTNSPLAILLATLRSAWSELSTTDDEGAFAAWLEQTSTVGAPDGGKGAVQLLDTLDSLLIAAIQEVEQIRSADLSAVEMEAELQRIWQRTYAFVASDQEESLAQVWLGRGRVIKSIYPDPVRRRQLYKTSLTPRSGTVLLERMETIRAALIDGGDYARLQPEEKFSFIRSIIALLSEIPAFGIGQKLGKKKDFKDWDKVLRWWIFKGSLAVQPSPNEVGNWYGFAAENFIYRGSWGLGAALGVLLDSGGEDEPLDALTIDDWPKSGLPWIAFWLKELINWGTLDPVAAFLLARGNALNRQQAEADARAYYAALDARLEDNEILNPRAIRDWVEERRTERSAVRLFESFVVPVELERREEDYRSQTLSVLPVTRDGVVHWIDPAGYVVARGEHSLGGDDGFLKYRFELDVAAAAVSGEQYLLHRWSTA